MTAQSRNRPPVTLTLSPEALTWLDELAAASGQSRSAAVEAMIRAARRAKRTEART